MDVYSGEHNVSPMTDTGDPSDGEKENDIDPLYNKSSRMELKIQSGESEDPPQTQSQSQRRAGEINVETTTTTTTTTATVGGQHTPMSSGEVNDSSNNIPIHNYSSHNHSHSLPISVQENGHSHRHESSVYDFNDSTSVSEESHNELPMVNVPMSDNSLSVSNKDCDRIQNEPMKNNQEKNRPLSHSVSEFSGHNHTPSHSQSNSISSHLSQSHQNFSQSHEIPHSQSHSVPQSIQGINQQTGHAQSQQAHLQNQILNASVSGQAGEQQSMSLDMSGDSFNANDSYDDSLSVVSEYSNPGNFDGIIRRTRGRPRGSKNGTGMGRGRGRGYKYARLSDEHGASSSYDLRNMSDPYSCQRRGRPRSRFIVDLGEQNHEAWTKSKEELKISDAELTTLLLSLLESRKDNKEPEDAETMLSLASSEYKKWSEKFTSQLSLLTHYASVHNTTCCTCLGIKKKKYIPVGTGKRGRPRKYPPPVGCDDDREKSVYGAANNAVKNMLGVSLGGALGSSVNLTMKHEDGGESLDDVQVPSLRDAVHMSEHMRHMAEHRDTPGHLKDPMDQDDPMRMSDHHNMQVNDDHLHMPQDLTRMAANQAHMNDNSDRMSAAPQAHMNDLRSSATDSPGRLSDTPAHMTDNLGRMSVENFGRMSGTHGGYLAEHLRRIAENQSRMSDSVSHFDDRDNYSRLGDNLRSMSRGSAGDSMGRLGENLSHMGVIRPSQASSTSQWPPHMQNHSALEGMNQSAQTSQHALYPLPFWPYDPSLRQYHH